MQAIRVAAIVTAAAGVAATGWLALGMPGPDFDDPWYRMAHARNLLPFAGAVAAIAMLVVAASGTARSRGRFASIALWLVLAGALLVFAAMAAQLWPWPAPVPRRYADYDAVVQWMRWMYLMLAAGALSLISGAALWIASYRLDRPRG